MQLQLLTLLKTVTGPVPYLKRCILHRCNVKAGQLKVLTLLVTASLVFAEVESSSCRRRFTRQIIHYNDCLPKRLLTYSCVGSCFTHAQVSATNPLELEHSCYQCKEAVTSIRKVKLRCPSSSNDGSNTFEEVTIDVPVPRECMCEICSTVDAIEVSRSQK